MEKSVVREIRVWLVIKLLLLLRRMICLKCFCRLANYILCSH